MIPHRILKRRIGLSLTVNYFNTDGLTGNSHQIYWSLLSIQSTLTLTSVWPPLFSGAVVMWPEMVLKSLLLLQMINVWILIHYHTFINLKKRWPLTRIGIWIASVFEMCYIEMSSCYCFAFRKDCLYFQHRSITASLHALLADQFIWSFHHKTLNHKMNQCKNMVILMRQKKTILKTCPI